MASTYSTNLKIELIGTGEQAGIWGNTTNTNLGTALEQAIVGKADINMSSTTITLTLVNANTAQNARAIYLNLTGTPGGAATLEVPAIQKPYIVRNGSNQVVTVKVSGQTGVTVPVGATMWLYNNGTDVTNAITNLPSGATVDNVAIVGTSTTQTLSNKTLTAPESTGAIYDNGSVRGNIVAVSALNIDCSAGNYFTKTISANSTFTVSNVPASRSYAFTLELTHTSGTVTWFSGVQWPGGNAPTLTNGKTSLLVFVTDDGGTRWRGAALVDYTT